MAEIAQDLPNEAAPAPRRGRKLVRIATFVAWGAALAFQGFRTVGEPSKLNLVTMAGFIAFFFLGNAQLFLMRWMGERRLRHTLMRMSGSSYLSDLDGLPNRNYLLSELRREMPRARASGQPFVLIVLAMDTFDEIVARRGEEFGQRTISGLAQVLKRFTRTSDFIAHLGGPAFCVMLNDCKFDDAFIYLGRVPGSIAVSDGHRMLEVPVSARLHQYDLQAMYATDVLRDAEETRPLRRKEQQRYGTEAA